MNGKQIVVVFHLTQTSNKTKSPAGEIHVTYLVTVFFFHRLCKTHLLLR